VDNGAALDGDVRHGHELDLDLPFRLPIPVGDHPPGPQVVAKDLLPAGDHRDPPCLAPVHP
jgi:hypothetical protein